MGSLPHPAISTDAPRPLRVLQEIAQVLRLPNFHAWTKATLPLQPYPWVSAFQTEQQRIFQDAALAVGSKPSKPSTWPLLADAIAPGIDDDPAHPFALMCSHAGDQQTEIEYRLAPMRLRGAEHSEATQAAAQICTLASARRFLAAVTPGSGLDLLLECLPLQLRPAEGSFTSLLAMLHGQRLTEDSGFRLILAVDGLSYLIRAAVPGADFHLTGHWVRMPRLEFNLVSGLSDFCPQDFSNALTALMSEADQLPW